MFSHIFCMGTVFLHCEPVSGTLSWYFAQSIFHTQYTGMAFLQYVFSCDTVESSAAWNLKWQVIKNENKWLFWEL